MLEGHCDIEPLLSIKSTLILGKTRWSGHHPTLNALHRVQTSTLHLLLFRSIISGLSGLFPHIPLASSFSLLCLVLTEWTFSLSCGIWNLAQDFNKGQGCAKYHGKFKVWFSCFQKNQWEKTAKEWWGKRNSISLFPTLAFFRIIRTCYVPGNVWGTGNSVSGTVSKGWAGWSWGLP